MTGHEQRRCECERVAAGDDCQAGLRAAKQFDELVGLDDIRIALRARLSRLRVDVAEIKSPERGHTNVAMWTMSTFRSPSARLTDIESKTRSRGTPEGKAESTVSIWFSSPNRMNCSLEMHRAVGLLSVSPPVARPPPRLLSFAERRSPLRRPPPPARTRRNSPRERPTEAFRRSAAYSRWNPDGLDNANAS